MIGRAPSKPAPTPTVAVGAQQTAAELVYRQRPPHWSCPTCGETEAEGAIFEYTGLFEKYPEFWICYACDRKEERMAAAPNAGAGRINEAEADEEDEDVDDEDEDEDAAAAASAQVEIYHLGSLVLRYLVFRYRNQRSYET